VAEAELDVGGQFRHGGVSRQPSAVSLGVELTAYGLWLKAP
jgi:hypothetical protein